MLLSHSDASLTSNMLRLRDPVKFRMTEVAPSILVSSSGDSIAAFAAATDAPSPRASPMPMMALPPFAMVVLTSAKSRFTMP